MLTLSKESAQPAEGLSADGEGEVDMGSVFAGGAASSSTNGSAASGDGSLAEDGGHKVSDAAHEVVALAGGHGHGGGAKSGIAGASFNFMNTIVGAGLVGVAYALREAGLVVGLFLFCFVSAIVYYTVRLIVRLGVSRGRNTYETLAQLAFGKTGYIVLCLSTFIFAYGAMLAYVMIAGDTISVVVANMSGNNEFIAELRPYAILGVATLFMLPLSLLKNLSALAHSSMISLMSVSWIILFVIIRLGTGAGEGYDPATPEDSAVVPVGKQVFPAIGIIAFGFVCHHNSFLVYNSLENATTKRWDKTTAISVTGALSICALIASCGYGTFRGVTQSNLFNAYSPEDNLANITRVFFALVMILTYPMEMYVARHSLHSSIFRSTVTIPNARFIVFTVALWASTVIIGIVVRDLGIVLELFGGMSGSVIGFIGPALLHLKLEDGLLRDLKNGSREALKIFAPSIFVLCFGLTVLISVPLSIFFFHEEHVIPAIDEHAGEQKPH